MHGAVALEMKGLIQTPDPEATYRATLDMVLRGLAPADPARLREWAPMSRMSEADEWGPGDEAALRAAWVTEPPKLTGPVLVADYDPDLAGPVRAGGGPPP